MYHRRLKVDPTLTVDEITNTSYHWEHYALIGIPTLQVSLMDRLQNNKCDSGSPFETQPAYSRKSV